jgi:hypothetical protein
MLEDGIPPSLRGSVDFVALIGIPTRGQGVRHVDICWHQFNLLFK